jgi:hypothetical protein
VRRTPFGLGGGIDGGRPVGGCRRSERSGTGGGERRGGRGSSGGDWPCQDVLSEGPAMVSLSLFPDLDLEFRT